MKHFHSFILSFFRPFILSSFHRFILSSFHSLVHSFFSFVLFIRSCGTGEDIAMMPEFVCGDVTGDALRVRVSTELSEGKPLKQSINTYNIILTPINNLLTRLYHNYTSTELSEAAVVWANDFTWGEEAQRVVEDMALDSLPDGAVMVR